MVSSIRVAARFLEAEAPSRWQEFLDAVYEGGKKKIPNPDPDTRESHPEIAVSTLLQKDKNYRKKLMDQFRRWKKKHETAKVNPDVIPLEVKPSEEIVEFVDHDSHVGAVVDLLDKASKGVGIDPSVAKAFKKHLEGANEEVIRATNTKGISDETRRKIRDTKDYLDGVNEWVAQSKDIVEDLLGESTGKQDDKVELEFSNNEKSKFFVADASIEKAQKNLGGLFNTKGKAATFKRSGLTKEQNKRARRVHDNMPPETKALVKNMANIGQAYAKKHPVLEDVDEDMDAFWDNRRPLSKAFEDQYAFTQAFFRDRGDKHITVYRNADDTSVDPERVSDWTLDPYRAAKGDGRMVALRVPVEFIVQSGLTNPSLGMGVKIHPKGYALTARDIP